MNNVDGYTNNASPHITVGSNSVHENAMPRVEGVSDVVPLQTSVLHLEREEGEEATVPGISALKRSLSVAYDDDEPSYNSVSPALRSSIGFERSSLHDTFSPVEFAMNKLTEQATKLKALERQVETTGIRAPCPTQDGNIIDFDAYMMSLSHPQLFEEEKKKTGEPPKMTRGGTIARSDLKRSSRNVSSALDLSDSSKESSYTPCFEVHTPQSMVAMFEEQRKIAERVSEENRRIRNSGKSHVAVFYPFNHTEDEKGLIFAAKCPKCFNVDMKFMLDSKDKELSSFVVVETYAGSGVDLECLCCRHTFKFCHGHYSFLSYPKQNCVTISFEWAKVELLGDVDISKYPIEV